VIVGESNIDQVVADLERWVDGFDFERTGAEGSLGRDIVKAVAEGIAKRGAEQHRGAVDAWADNADNPPGKGYASWKQKRYGHREPNVRTGQMLSMPSLTGSGTTIEPEKITMVYGDGTKTARPVVAADSAKTDQEKAYHAHTGQGPQGIKRPFYELDDELAGDVRKMIAEALNEYVHETTTGG